MSEPSEGAAPVDETLVSFIHAVNNSKLIIPESVIKHYLNKNGVDTDDPTILKIISLATQKFVTNIATESLHNTMIADSTVKKEEKDSVFTLDTLIPILEENGIKIKKPHQFE